MKIKTIALALLALAATAQADDMNKAEGANMQPAPGEQTTATTPTPAPTKGTVARAIITNGIENREPTSNLTDVTTETEKVYYFTELRDMEGETVTHRWEHNGQTMAEVPFPVGGSRWRIYSSKNLLPDWTGEWRVSVVDAAGNTLRADTFMYTQAPAATAMPNEVPKDATASTSNGMQAETRARQ